MQWNNVGILVTGGAGFIGSNLIERLLELGCRVVCLDNFLTGKRENIAPFHANPRFRLIEGDIRDRDVCREAVEGMEFVLHEAALGSVPRSIHDPMTTVDINVSGFVNVLFAAHAAGVRRVVYAASSSTYGDSTALPKREEEIGTPLSPYAITKYADELFAANFGRIYNQDTIGLRYFNVFGPRQDPEGAYAAVVPRFARALLRHESPVINGDGSYSRDFTFVTNVVEANLLALSAGPEAAGCICNIACGTETSLNKLFLRMREELTKFDPEIAAIEPEYGPVRAGDIPQSLADISRAKRVLGYEPRFDVSTGLRLAAGWYFRNL